MTGGAGDRDQSRFDSTRGGSARFFGGRFFLAKFEIFIDRGTNVQYLDARRENYHLDTTEESYGL